MKPNYEVFEKLITSIGVTPYRVAKETGISSSSLSDWKNNKSVPKIDKMIKIADFLDVSVDYLCGVETDEKQKKDTLSEVPETHFTNAEDAMKFIIEQPMIAFEGGYDLNKMTDEEVVEFANDIIDLLKIAARKYKNR